MAISSKDANLQRNLRCEALFCSLTMAVVSLWVNSTEVAKDLAQVSQRGGESPRFKGYANYLLRTG